MKPKHYWLLSDGKTVKELSQEEYLSMAIKDLKRHARNPNADVHTFVTVWDTEIHFSHGQGLTIKRCQLEKVLRAEE